MAKRIITISREFGSGGRVIGKMVAEKMGIAFYDRDIIALVAEKSGFAVNFVEEVDEEITSSFLFNIVTSGLYSNSGFTRTDMPIQDNVFLIQNTVINEIAAKEPCVIVGRSADYILRKRTDCLHVFIHADMEHRKARAVNHYGWQLPEKNIEKELQKKDKARANHYRRYTDQIWGLSRNYHVTLNSGHFGLEGCADIIVELANK